MSRLWLNAARESGRLLRKARLDPSGLGRTRTCHFRQQLRADDEIDLSRAGAPVRLGPIPARGWGCRPISNGRRPHAARTGGAITALALVVCAFLALVSFDLGIPGQELLQSLRFHIAALLFCPIVLLLAGGAWWRAVILLLPLMASLGEGASIIHTQQQAHQAAAAPGTTPLFRLLSFNLLNDNENGAAIADYIVNSGADIVMVMEGGPLSRHRDKVFAAYPTISAASTLPAARPPSSQVAADPDQRARSERVLSQAAS